MSYSWKHASVHQMKRMTPRNAAKLEVCVKTNQLNFFHRLCALNYTNLHLLFHSDPRSCLSSVLVHVNLDEIETYLVLENIKFLPSNVVELSKIPTLKKAFIWTVKSLKLELELNKNDKNQQMSSHVSLPTQSSHNFSFYRDVNSASIHKLVRPYVSKNTNNSGAKICVGLFEDYKTARKTLNVYKET